MSEIKLLFKTLKVLCLQGFSCSLSVGSDSKSLSTFIQIANALKIPSDELLVDNLLASNSTRDGDEYYMLLDCSQEEATILIKNMKNLKEILRTYTIK